MPAEAVIEQRLTAVETAIADIRRQLPPPASGWLDQLIGSQADEPAFDDVVALGRAFRV